jgi:hypothetical protein
VLADCDALSERVGVADEPMVAVLVSDTEADEEREADDVLENDTDPEREVLGVADAPGESACDGVAA